MKHDRRYLKRISGFTALQTAARQVGAQLKICVARTITRLVPSVTLLGKKRIMRHVCKSQMISMKCSMLGTILIIKEYHV